MSFHQTKFYHNLAPVLKLGSGANARACEKALALPFSSVVGLSRFPTRSMSHDSFEKNSFITDRKRIDSCTGIDYFNSKFNHDSWDSESTQPYSVQQIFATEGGTEGLREAAIVAICYASK